MGILLRWSVRSVGATQTVYRSDGPFNENGLPAALAVIAATDTSYNDTTVIAGKEYYYAIAVNYGSRVVLSKVISETALGGLDGGGPVIPASAVSLFLPNAGQVVDGGAIEWTDALNSYVARCGACTIDADGAIQTSGSSSGVRMDNVIGFGWPSGAFLAIGYEGQETTLAYLLSNRGTSYAVMTSGGTGTNLYNGGVPNGAVWVGGSQIIEDGSMTRGDFYDLVSATDVLSYNNVANDDLKNVAYGTLAGSWECRIYAMMAFTDLADMADAEAYIQTLKPF